MLRWCLIAALFVLEPVLADEPALPRVDAKAYYLFDANSGTVLAESNASERLDPASLTKLMTAYLAFAALERNEVSMNDPVKVSERAWRETGSRTFIEVNTEVAYGDLVRGMIIQSGNDAAVAIAEHLGGSVEGFVEIMNETALRLGMTGTRYRNPNGLPASGHVSTAHDMAVLARALIHEYPQYYSLYSEREFTYNDITQHNRNELLWRDEGVDGLKTGYTRAAGYCLVSSAERDGMRLISVIFGSSTPDARTESTVNLLNYGFEAYETHKLYTRGEAVAEARVFKGDLDTLPVGPAGDVYVTVPRGAYASLEANAALTTNLVAPLAQDQAVGELEVRFDGEPLAVMPLVALAPVHEGWLLTRVTDGMALWFD